MWSVDGMLNEWFVSMASAFPQIAATVSRFGVFGKFPVAYSRFERLTSCYRLGLWSLPRMYWTCGWWSVSTLSCPWICPCYEAWFESWTFWIVYKIGKHWNDFSSIKWCILQFVARCGQNGVQLRTLIRKQHWLTDWLSLFIDDIRHTSCHSPYCGPQSTVRLRTSAYRHNSVIMSRVLC